MGTLALGLGAAGVGGVLLASHLRGAPDASLHGLARAAGFYRTIKPRLSGEFRHAECARDDGTRLVGGLICRNLPPEPPSLGEFAARFHQDRIATDSGDAAHVAGVFGLFWPGQEASVEQAIADLRTAADAQPDRADVQSDLAAALLAYAEAAEDPASLVDAYLAADSAVTLDGALPQARFNLALVLEWLYLYPDAEAAWRTYIEIDSRSLWAQEARAHLDRLRIPPPDPDELRAQLGEAVVRGDSAAVYDIVGQVPWIARREVVEEALPLWAEARREGRIEQADSALRFARAMGLALGRITGNTLPAEAVAAIDSAVITGDSVRLGLLIGGQIALAEGTENLDVRSMNLSTATERLDTARELLGKAHSAMAGWATYRRAEAWYQGSTVGSYRRALEILTSILSDSSPGHSALRARAAQVVGLIHDIRADYEPAVAAYDTAIEAADLALEIALATRVRGWRSQLLLALRGRRAAWQDLYTALGATSAIVDAPRSHWSVLRDVVRAIATEAPDLAVRFQGEVVRWARMDTPAAAVGALAQRAGIFTESGDFAQASRDIDEADRLAQDAEDIAIRAIQLAIVDLARGQLGIALDPEGGTAALQRTLATYRATGDFFGRARANLYLADAYLARNIIDSAEVALRAAAAEMERRRNEVRDFQERTEFLDHARPAFERMLRFYADQRSPEVAFEFFQRTRARVLQERLEEHAPSNGGRESGLPSSREIQARLPHRVTMISYAVLGDELLTWVVRNTSIRLIRTTVTASELARLVQQLESAILRGRQKEAQPLAAILYDRIIRPIRSEIGPDHRLVITPDKWLHFVPFAALWDDERHQYLIEQHEISLAPSAQVFLTASARLATRPPVEERVLVIGNPVFDRRRFPFPDLPGAVQEADNIARLYPRSQLVVGAAATRASLLRSAPSAGIVHFAGHAVVRPDAPLLSHLVLSPAAGDADVLYAREVFDLDLRDTRLAILSGCHTSGGYLSGTEGVSSLARAFLAAGVSVVVASLWAVEDQQTAELFGAFHRRVADGEGPTAALRATQLEWIRSSDHRHDARTWAAFQSFGG